MYSQHNSAKKSVAYLKNQKISNFQKTILAKNS